MGDRWALGLTGYPLSHSLSPQLHRAALDGLGLAGEYRLYPIPPLPEGSGALEGLLQRLHAGQLDGLNVTIPHKQSVIRWLDELSPAAGTIGAVNTLLLRAGRLAGENTDAPGFLADLQRVAGPFLPHAAHALVLGAGGSARAITYALVQAGWQVTVAARRLAQAQALILQVVGEREQASATVLNPETLQHLPPDVTLVVNTTPLGMAPDVQATPWPEDIPFPAGAFVYDLVYNPAETRLVGAARKAGRPAATGLGMLIEQAARSFELWTGHRAPRQSMYAAVSNPYFFHSSASSPGREGQT